MGTNTTNYSFSKPTVDGDEDTWGTQLNGNWDKTDSLLSGGQDISSLSITTSVTLKGQGDLVFKDSDSSHSVSLQAPATIASNYTLTMPTGDGSNGQVLTTDGSGGLSFTTITGFSGAFGDLTGKPTTISGYGITDALQLGTTATTALAGNTSIPSSLTDLGISDGTSNQVLSTDGSGTFTFVDQSGGGGGDADTLDGLDSTSFLRSDATDTFTGTQFNIDNELRITNGDGTDTHFNFDNGGSANYIRGSSLDIDVTGITSISYSGVDALNFDGTSASDNRGISFNGRTALSTDDTDGWLRLNQDSEFSNGIFTPSSLRVDGTLTLNGSGYGLSANTSIHMNNYEINYVNQLHFNDNVRFYDEGNDSYLIFKYGDATTGGIQFYNGGGTRKGYIYADNSGFGLLDNDGNWAVRTQTGTTPLELRCDNNHELSVGTTYVEAHGRFRSQAGYTNNTGVDTNKQFGISFSNADPLDSNGYALLRESGAWSSPYPDIRMNAHTGFNMRANNAYDGVRIFRDYNSNSRIIQFNGASNYIYKDVWMNITTQGFYSNTNSMHLTPNASTSYAALAVTGSKGSYGGLVDAYSGVHFMHDSSGNGGNYRQANSRWYFYHHVGNNCTGFSGSTTSSSYTIYVSGAIYATGNITAYSDRRMKENIVTIDSALDKVCAMRGVYYNKIDDETKTRQVGVIAQEMLEPEACPEAVTYAEDVDEYGVSYGNLVGVLIEAVKELRQEVAELKGN